MKLSNPDALYMISEPEAAAAPAVPPAAQPEAGTMEPRPHSWRDLMRRMEEKQQ